MPAGQGKQSSQPSMSANPRGEGVYKMQGPDGNSIGIPYSNVPEALHGGYKLYSSDAPRFLKNYKAAAPGFLSSAYNATPLPLVAYAVSHPINCLRRQSLSWRDLCSSPRGSLWRSNL